MDTKQAFSLVVRVIGLILVILGVIYLIDGFVMLFDPTFRSKPGWHYFVDGGMLLPIGMYLLRGAACIIRFAFPAKNDKKDTSHDA
jgi:cytochrome b subunit of formate dehydrogenase